MASQHFHLFETTIGACAVVWEALPVAGQAYHGKYARNEVYTLLPPLGSPGRENTTVTPIPGDGSARFQPVAVDDVADAIAAALDHPDTIGQTLELAGPDVVSYEQLLGVIAQQLGVSRRTVHIPMPLMRFVVAASRPLPKRLRPPVTADQLKMLRIDNVSANPATGRLIGRPPRHLAGNLGYIERH